MSAVVEMLPSPEVMCRADLPVLFNARGLTTVGVEIGVDRGTFAKEILTHWKGRELFGVDPWQPYQDMPWERSADLLLATMTLVPFGDRIRLVRMTSAAFAPICQIGHLLCFVYIDGDHAYDAVAADLQCWWDLLPPNGMLSGHDFDHEHLGVRHAVTEFALRIGRPIRYTPSGNEPGSFYFYKTEPLTMINVQNFSQETR